MEENVALDSSKQKDFVKSIKGIKKLIKNNDTVGALIRKSGGKSKHGKSSKPKRKPRGLVYLGHIPHGFYEHEMTQYFKQFGVVTNVRVIRSKRTGRSKGFAFVEFKDPAVGEIVAETMNNYLMGKRLIKAEYIPPEKQRHWAMRKKWSTVHNPTSVARLKMKKQINSTKTESEDMKIIKSLLSGFRNKKKKLVDIGINYDFFTPVDVPEGINLDHEPRTKKEKASMKPEVKEESSKIKKKVKKETKVQVNNVTQVNKSDKKEVTKVEDNKPKKKAKKPVAADSNEQDLKEEKLKNAGVKHVQNYIRIKESQDSDNDSDSSYDFDSDEFEKMIKIDSAASSGEESENEDSEEENIPQKKTTTHKIVNAKPKPNKVNKQQSSPQLKRKANQKATPVTSKKSKFEKKNSQKLPKKSFEKK